jgi:hypothetical protein
MCNFWPVLFTPLPVSFHRVMMPASGTRFTKRLILEWKRLESNFAPVVL